MKALVLFILSVFIGTQVHAIKPTNKDSILLSIQKLKSTERLEYLSDLTEQANSQEELDFWLTHLVEEPKGEDSLYWLGMIAHHKARIANFAGKVDESIRFRESAIAYFIAIENYSKVAKQYNNIGNSHANSAQYDSSIFYYSAGMAIGEKLKDSTIIGSSLLNISTIYNNKGQKKEELEYLLKALEIGRATNDSSILAPSLFNLGVHYSYENDHAKSSELLNEVVKIYTKRNDKFGIATTFNLKAKNAFDVNDFEAALLYLDSAMMIYKELEYFSRVASINLNIGQVSAELGKTKLSKEKFRSAYEDFLKVGDLRYAAIALHDLAMVSFKEKEYLKSVESYIDAIEMLDSIGVLDLQSAWMKELSEVYKTSGEMDLAYESLLAHISLQDSLAILSNQESIRRMEAQFQNEKKQLEIDNLQNESELQQVKIEKEHQQNQLLYIGLLLSFLLVIGVSFGFYRKQKDNKIIRSQKSLLEERHEELNTQKAIVEQKNTEITDSINYAKKIQEAVLPPMKIFKEAFQNSFIFYKPKDIVAGDFYWFYKKENSFLFASADCTGHGVPGALVSVVCSNALNRAVGEYGLEEPSKILDQCQKIVIENLGNSHSEIKDGMDISLCSYSKDTGILEYSGANNPLWLVSDKEPKTESEINKHNEEGSKYLFELKADKCAIGQVEKGQSFRNHQIKLNSGDRIYLFSDGYMDQFGGDLGKKLKSKNLKELILKYQSEPIEKQGQLLSKFFNSWKGDLEQLDDVCFIGIEV